jgi:hypothetical protein
MRKMSKTRQDIYLRVCKKAYSLICESLENEGIDSEEVSIYIKLKNHEFDEEFEME